MQGLPFETVTQFAALGITLIAGWLFGLASARGGKRWRARYQESDEVRRKADTDLAAANRRIRELEVENERLRKVS